MNRFRFIIILYPRNNNNEAKSIHYYYYFRGYNNNEPKSIHYYYFREIIIMVRGGGVPPSNPFFLGGRLMNELEDIRMNWGSAFFWGEDLRMNWKTYEWIGVPTFFGGEDIRMNWKTYEWIGRHTSEWIWRHTNELGFSLFLVCLPIHS